MEESLKPRSQPVVRIDTTPRGPRAQQLQAWAQPLPMTPQPTIASLSPTATPDVPPIATPNAPPTPLHVHVTPQVTMISSPQAPVVKLTPPSTSVASPPLATVPPLVSSPAPFGAPQSVLKTVPVAAATAVSTGPPGPARAQVPVQSKVVTLPPGVQSLPATGIPPPGGTASGGDPMLVAMLSRLVDQVDALHLSQQTVLTSNGLMLQKLADQTIGLKNNRAELDRIGLQRAALAKNVETSQPMPPVASVSVPSITEGTHNKFYAVAKGRRVGVFTRWKDAERSVHGYSGAVHKRFRSERAPREWLNARSGDARPDDTLDFSDDVTQHEGTVYGDGSRTQQERPRRPTSIVDPGHAGPDPSVGKPNEIHNTSIQVESEVLELLCPKGVTAQTRRDLMDAAPDVLSLPGKLGSTINDSSEMWDQFAGAVNEMAEQQTVRAGTQVRDTQWRGAPCNALDKIKTMDDVFDAAEAIGNQSDKVMTSFEASIQEILYTQGWAKDDVELYVASGPLPRIIQRTMALYYELYLHFQKLIAQNPDHTHFKEFTLLHMKYHARQLRQIRLYAARRSQMVLRSYTYLRDAKAKAFNYIRLVGEITQKLQEMTHQLSEHHMEKPTAKPPKEWACAHCHSELHTGGMATCPLTDFKAKTARRLAKEAAKHLRRIPACWTAL
jgi:hypothetical protein